MTPAQFRALALAVEGATEGRHQSGPDFRLGGKIFASLQDAKGTAGLRLTPDEQALVLQNAPGAFHPASGAWGRQGWTVVTLSEATVGVVREAVARAAQGLLARAAPSARKRRPRPGVTAAGTSAPARARSRRPAR